MAKVIFRWFSFVVLVSVMTSCGTMKSPYYSDESQDWESLDLPEENRLIHTLYLIGDGGELDDKERHRNYVLDAASEMLKAETKETSLVYLGDNIYPHGLSAKGELDREEGERILDAHLALSRSHAGNTYFIPGNHDWNIHKPGGRAAILRQEAYIQAYAKKNSNVYFYPRNACADPKVIQMDDDHVYIFLDTQWWLQDWTGEVGINKDCDIKTRETLIPQLEQIFNEYIDDEIIVMLHHPIKSNGMHGGHFSIRHHLFPLTELNRNLWIPLPILGSIHPLYRRVVGFKQDITHHTNQELMQGIDDLAQKLGARVIFASGHEHGLQFFNDELIKYIVSGGGSKNDYVQRGGSIDYAREARGFAIVKFYNDNETWLEMYTIGGFDQKPILEYRTQLRAPR